MASNSNASVGPRRVSRQLSPNLLYNQCFRTYDPPLKFIKALNTPLQYILLPIAMVTI